MSGADLSAQAQSARGSDASAKQTSSVGALGNSGFDAAEAEAWLQSRWKLVQASSTDKRVAEARKCDNVSVQLELYWVKRANHLCLPSLFSRVVSAYV